MDILGQLTLATILIIATQQDWKNQKIPDKLTGPAILLGLAINLMTTIQTATWQPVAYSTIGGMLALAIGIFLVRVNFWSAGDSKLLIACATFYGFGAQLLDFTLITIVTVGIQLSICYAKDRKKEWVSLAHCFLVAWLIVFLEPIVKGLF